MENIKRDLRASIAKAIIDKKPSGIEVVASEIVLTTCRTAAHGDLTSNIAFLLAAQWKQAPQLIAQIVADALVLQSCARVEAVAGYLNFTLHTHIKCAHMLQWLQYGVAVNSPSYGNKQRVLMEFVSANPTGPLHVGHGRQAAVADVLAKIFRKCGYVVDTEYYVNDAGTQMDVLVSSVWVRMLQQQGVAIRLVSGLYQGDYLLPIATQMLTECTVEVSSEDVAQWLASLPEDLCAHYHAGTQDKDATIALLQAVVRWTKQVLQDFFMVMHRVVLDRMMSGIVEELSALKVVMDHYASEQSYVASGAVGAVLTLLTQRGFTYHHEGALWFAATRFGDDKDRVLLRSNGEHTYFTNDIAYHWDKVSRGYKRLINFLGSDHHGYVLRLKAALCALDAQTVVDVRLVQFVHLLKKGERIAMSTRLATFEPLHEVIKECGCDATRFFYTHRHIDQPLDFDMDLAMTQSQENPVYYVQYAHARLCRLLAKAQDVAVPQDFAYAMTPEELSLWEQFTQYDAMLLQCVEHLDACYLAQYVYALAKKVHNYYNNVPVLQADEDTKAWRIVILTVAMRTLALSLDLLGVDAPLSM